MKASLLLIGVTFLACSAGQKAKLMPDGKVWTTENVAIETPGSTCYDSLPANCDKYGRLYTWKAATTVCEQLGAGWRLPSNDEWKNLAKNYGGIMEESVEGSKATFKAMIAGGPSGFNALFSGGRDDDGKYRRLEAHGFYWTSTPSSDTTAWLYNFGKNGGLLNRHSDGSRKESYAVRCVKD